MPPSKKRDHWYPSRPVQSGTHGSALRNRTLAQTEDLARACLPRCGVTRIADVTDLDIVGIPVFHTVRPQAAPGLNTVTSGKGATPEAARVSAIMEAIERTWCEPPSQATQRQAAYAELQRANVPSLDPRRLILRRGGTWTPDVVLSWWLTREINSDIEVLLPSLAIFTPYPAQYGMFRSNTIGLASGNNPQEALLHGLLEVIEQDCTAFGETLRGGSRIRLKSLPDSLGALVEKFEQADVSVRLYVYLNDLAVPTVFATVDDTHSRDGMLINGGAGCHLDPIVAATRALTEAAQSRLDVIGGAREDLDGQAYRRHASYEGMRGMLRNWESGRPEIDFDQIPSESTGTTGGDLTRIIGRLDSAGLPLVFATELAPDDLPFSVTKVVVPGLETHHHDPRRLGVRLHRAMADAGKVRSLS
jgi:putative methanogenesis marker protein 1